MNYKQNSHCRGRPDITVSCVGLEHRQITTIITQASLSSDADHHNTAAAVHCPHPRCDCQALSVLRLGQGWTVDTRGRQLLTAARPVSPLPRPASADVSGDQGSPQSSRCRAASLRPALRDTVTVTCPMSPGERRSPSTIRIPQPDINT